MAVLEMPVLNGCFVCGQWCSGRLCQDCLVKQSLPCIILPFSTLYLWDTFGIQNTANIFPINFVSHILTCTFMQEKQIKWNKMVQDSMIKERNKIAWRKWNIMKALGFNFHLINIYKNIWKHKEILDPSYLWLHIRP